MQVIKTWPILIIPKDVFFMFFSRSNEPLHSRLFAKGNRNVFFHCCSEIESRITSIFKH